MFVSLNQKNSNMENVKEQSNSPIVAFDLGSKNSVVVSDGKVVVDVPSIMAISYEEGVVRILAKWEDAMRMVGRGSQDFMLLHENNFHYNNVEYFVRELALEAKEQCTISAETRIGVGIPIDFTYAKRLCLREAFEKIGCTNVFVMKSPFAVAISHGFDVSGTRGIMIIDIGNEKTQIAVLCMDRIVVEKCIPVGGDSFTRAIQNGVRCEYGIRISEHSSEEIKKILGTTNPNVENAPSEYVVRGPHQVTASPMEKNLAPDEIAGWFDELAKSIENSVYNVLDETPPELFNDIASDGIWLSGGGSLLHGLSERLEKQTNIKVKPVDDPFHSVARGVEMAMKDMNNYQFIVKL